MQSKASPQEAPLRLEQIRDHQSYYTDEGEEPLVIKLEISPPQLPRRPEKHRHPNTEKTGARATMILKGTRGGHDRKFPPTGHG